MLRHPTLVRLHEDHHRGISLALLCRKQALGQVPSSPTGLKDAADHLRYFFEQHLNGHFRAEEELLFPLFVAAKPDGSILTKALSRDHQKIREGVKALSSAANLGRLLFDLGDLLEQHMRREERELFPLLATCLAGDEAERVKQQIERFTTTT